MESTELEEELACAYKELRRLGLTPDKIKAYLDLSETELIEEEEEKPIIRTIEVGAVIQGQTMVADTILLNERWTHYNIRWSGHQTIEGKEYLVNVVSNFQIEER
jgi:hypothetical protein